MLDGADSIPLGAVSLAAAHKLLSIFSLLELQQVLVALVHIVVFFGYPALMPLIFRVLLVERLGHTLVLTLQPGAPTNPNAPSHYIALSLLTMIEARFALSFRRDTARGSPPR